MAKNRDGIEDGEEGGLHCGVGEVNRAGLGEFVLGGAGKLSLNAECLAEFEEQSSC